MKNQKIQIGFNLNHAWLKGRSFASVVNPLVECGLKVIEVHIDFRFPDIGKHIDSLCKNASQFGLGINFHAPYLDPPLMLGFARENRKSLMSKWRPVLDLVNTYSSINGIRTEMVLHGSHGPKASMDNLFADTVELARWILDYCPNLYVGIENLPTPRNPSEMVKFGEDRKSVFKAVKSVNHPRCGITWDMGHCVRNNVLELPSEEWVNKVVHVHVHDVDETRQDHWPLILNRTPYLEWINYLVENNFSGTITAELNGILYKSWSQKKIDDNLLLTIQKIKNAIDLSSFRSPAH